MTEVLPLLYLHGLSTGDFAPALEQFLGTGAGLSASAITRLTVQWQDEARAFAERDLSEVDYVYLWVDGIHLKVRLDQEKLCLLVMIGVRADGRKSSSRSPMASGNPPNPGPICCVIAAAAACGRRCSRSATARWGSGRPCGRCSPTPASSAAGGTSRPMFLPALPKSAHPGALAALKEIYNAEDIDKAQVAIKAFEIDYGAKYPKAVAKIVADTDVLLEFYRYPAEHWIHLRTTNPIESTFATVRLRTKVTKGPGSRAAGLAMAYKLIEAAQTRWRAVNAPHLVALVRTGAVFHKGKLLERPIDITPAEPDESHETEVA